MVSTLVSAPNSPSTTALILSTATMATISATPSNFSCASDLPSTVMTHTSTRNTSPERKNDDRARPPCASSSLVRRISERYWVWRGWNAPNPMIHHSSNFVPTAHCPLTTMVPLMVPLLSPVARFTHRSRLRLPLAPAYRPVPPTMVPLDTT